eukprot:m.22566 g.22566  ORF g.22566 m.22566 type:complete len:466 (-) comp11269_c0_seq1:176-1573(-)
MASDEVTVIKQGWLLKRGEYIKTWRPRWFQLRSNGDFRGFKTGPPAPGDAPVNLFDVSGSTLSITDDGKPVGSKGKKYGFMVRFMQLTRFVERSFHLESQDERDEWVQAYEDVKKSIHAQAPAPRAEPAPGEATQKTVTIDDFEMLKVLGKGTFGKVMLAKEKDSGQLFAIKVLKKEVILEKEEVAHTMTENTVLQSTNHPFLTGLKYSFQTKELLCFVLEYVNGGELFFHLSREKVFTEDRARFYAAEIALAIGYLHDHGIIYRDLKLENLLLDNEGHVKITDFGLCKQEMTFGTTTTTFCGTPEYLAPEILEDNDYGRSVDWWGLGVVMYEMMCGHLPFYNRNHEVLFDLILHEEIRLPDHLSPAAKDILSKMLDKNPHTRLGGGQGDGREITDHAFFASIDLVKLYNKQLPVPFKPKVTSATDVSNFDPMFTTEVAQVSPTEQSALQEADAAFANFEDGAKP